MKRSQKFTQHSVDNKVKKWELLTSKLNTHIPYIKTQDIKSKGSKNRSPDFENPGKDRDFLSINESLFYLHLLFDKRITWIKEQYPLLPVNRAQYFAGQLGFRYPTYPYSNSVPVVMTSDFYCGTIFGGEVVYSIKSIKEIENTNERKRINTENKQKIEQTFWRAKGVKWHLILDTQIKTVFASNLEMLAPSIQLKDPLQWIFPRWFEITFNALPQFIYEKCADFITHTAKATDLSFEQANACFHHALWHQKISANLHIPLNYAKTLNELGVAALVD